jgi:hypothetical protein
MSGKMSRSSVPSVEDVIVAEEGASAATDTSVEERLAPLKEVRASW